MQRLQPLLQRLLPLQHLHDRWKLPVQMRHWAPAPTARMSTVQPILIAELQPRPLPIVLQQQRKTQTKRPLVQWLRAE